MTSSAYSFLSCISRSFSSLALSSSLCNPTAWRTQPNQSETKQTSSGEVREPGANLLARFRAGKHEFGAPEEVPEGRAGVRRGGAPDGAEGAVADGGLRGERGRELSEVGVEFARCGGGGGGGEEGSDGIGGGDGEARRGSGRRHGFAVESCFACWSGLPWKKRRSLERRRVQWPTKKIV